MAVFLYVEIIALAHRPTAAMRSKNLCRASQRTRPVPPSLKGEDSGVWVGDKLHEGVVSHVQMPMEVRLNHCPIL